MESALLAMESTLLAPTPSGDNVALSVEIAIARLRTTLAAARTDMDHNAHIPKLLADLARAAKAQGMKPESVAMAFRRVWEQEVADPLRAMSEESDLRRYRAIDTLLTAYFAGPAYQLRSNEGAAAGLQGDGWNGVERRHQNQIGD
jgi:hypothetical protein